MICLTEDQKNKIEQWIKDHYIILECGICTALSTMRLDDTASYVDTQTEMMPKPPMEYNREEIEIMISKISIIFQMICPNCGNLRKHKVRYSDIF